MEDTSENDLVFMLTFEEIKKLNEETEKYIKSQNYGFAPCMLIKIKKDEEWEEKEYISTTCLNEVIKNKPQEVNWIDITDENKFDFI